jgi:hypothetical protein
MIEEFLRLVAVVVMFSTFKLLLTISPDVQSAFRFRKMWRRPMFGEWLVSPELGLRERWVAHMCDFCGMCTGISKPDATPPPREHPRCSRFKQSLHSSHDEVLTMEISDPEVAVLRRSIFEIAPDAEVTLAREGRGDLRIEVRRRPRSLIKSAHKE